MSEKELTPEQLPRVAPPPPEAYTRTLRPDIAPLVVGRVASLPIDERGYPVPAFVPWLDGVPEFRAADRHFRKRAVRESLCWVCGQKLGAFKVFVIGPMCAINRTTSEPPCHFECAEFSVRACPFLTKPHMVRRTNDLPKTSPCDGFMIERNPGATALWVCNGDAFELFADGMGGTLLRIADPTRVEWFAAGRPASRSEVLRSINTGIPILLRTVPDGMKEEAAEEIAKRYVEIERLLPKAQAAAAAA